MNTAGIGNDMSEGPTGPAAERDGREPGRTASLRGVAARGAAVTGLSQACKIAITMVSLIVVARILSPTDYGVIAMTAPITGFILIFQNLGLSQAIVQARTIGDDQVNALFYYNMIASAAIAAVLVLISPLVAIFYDDPRPGYVTAASALTVLATGLTLQHTALLTRAMRFRALSMVDVANAALVLAVTLAFALWLRSYWALWIGAFAGAVANMAAVWTLIPWRPSRRIDFASARGMVRFGANLTGFNLLNFLSRNLDNVLIAKVWGPVPLGLYDRSYKLMMFPIQNLNAPLNRVMLPALSRVADEPERFRRMFVLAVRAISLAAVPGAIAAAICSDRLIPFLLGPKWADASPIFFWLSLASIAQPVSNATGWLFTATGRTKEMFRWGLISTPITIGSFVAGLPWGAAGVAAAYFLSQAVRVPSLYALCTRDTPVRARDLYAAIAPTLAGGLLAWGAAALVRDRLSDIAFFVMTGLLCYVLSAAVQACTRDGRYALAEMMRVVGDVAPRLRR